MPLGSTEQANARDREGEPVLCIVGKLSFNLWSRDTAERLAIQFTRHGIAKTINEAEAARHRGPVIFVRSDAVLDQPLIPVICKEPELLVLGQSSSGNIPVAIHTRKASSTALDILSEESNNLSAFAVRSPADLDVAFWQNLRKREVPYALVVDSYNKRQVEWRTFMGTYKGATDIITKRLWPYPAFQATRGLAAARISPNAVTAVAAILVFLAFLLFLSGHYVAGLAAAWVMTFLDTVDGKLARTTLKSSKWGDIFDHGLDLVHPPFWYIAWALGLQAVGIVWSGAMFWSVVSVILAGYVLQRLMEGVAIKWLRMEIHIWRPIDTWFREITARRNPNLILLSLSVLFGRPDIGLIAVAVWTALCLIAHAIQLIHAFQVKGRNGKLGSWMSDTANAK